MLWRARLFKALVHLCSSASSKYDSTVQELIGQKGGFLTYGFRGTHQACAVCRTTGKVLLNNPLDNKEDSIDKVLGSAGVKALVVVDQKRNIRGARARARSAGMDVAYLPRPAHEAIPGHTPRDRQDNEIDAKVIAHTTGGMPWKRLGPLLKAGGSGATDKAACGSEGSW